MNDKKEYNRTPRGFWIKWIGTVMILLGLVILIMHSIILILRFFGVM